LKHNVAAAEWEWAVECDLAAALPAAPVDLAELADLGLLSKCPRLVTSTL
jgi:hypothetical protein